MRFTTLITTLPIALLLPYFQHVKANNSIPITIEIHFDQHRFNPEKIEIHAGLPFVIRVVNSSKERIEFESFKLNREKVVDPGQTIVVHLPGLRAGRYDFFDDFHDDVPEGVIVAR